LERPEVAETVDFTCSAFYQQVEGSILSALAFLLMGGSAAARR
jgi:hypothetical protein